MTLDTELVEAIANDYLTANITENDKVMLNYVSQLTIDATRITKTHHEELEKAGFSPQAILQITMIASWFNYINRMADALGVGRE